MKHKIKLLDVIMITILLGSILVFLYPFVQNQLNELATLFYTKIIRSLFFPNSYFIIY